MRKSFNMKQMSALRGVGHRRKNSLDSDDGLPVGKKRSSSVALREQFDLDKSWSQRSRNGAESRRSRVSTRPPPKMSTVSSVSGVSVAESAMTAEDSATCDGYGAAPIDKFDGDEYGKLASMDAEGENSDELGEFNNAHNPRGPRRHGVRDIKTRREDDEQKRPLWQKWRPAGARLLLMAKFKCAMGAIIMLNMGLVVYDTDLEAATEPPPIWLEAVSTAFLCIYVFEIVLRFYVYQCHFFLQPMNVFDLYIVISDLVFKIVGDLLKDSPSLSVMRVLRCVRIVRVFRSFVVFRELYLMMQGLFSALKAIFWATFLLFVVLSIFGILAVTYLHPLNQTLFDEGAYDDCGEPCRDAFKSVMFSILHFIKTIIAGDSWGQVAMPLLTNYPLSACILISVLLITQIGVLNLIVAVIVDKAAEARREDKELQHNEKIENFHQATTDLMEVFHKMDHDNSGSLSKHELLEGFDIEESFAELLQLMDIGREDLTMVFYILDKDRSGDIDYKEFVEQLYMMKSQDPHTLLIFIRHIATNLEEAFKNFQTQIRDQVKMLEDRNTKADKHFDELKQLLVEHIALNSGAKTNNDGQAGEAEQKPETNCHAVDSERNSDPTNCTEDLLYGSLEYLRLQVQRDASRLQRQVENDLNTLSERIVRNTAIVVGQAHRHSSLQPSTRSSALAVTPRVSPPSTDQGREALSPVSQRSERQGSSPGKACFPPAAKKPGYGKLAALLKETSDVLSNLQLPEGEHGLQGKSVPPVPDFEWGIKIDSCVDMPKAPTDPTPLEPHGPSQGEGD